MNNLLTIKNLKVTFHTDYAKVFAVQGIDLTVGEGEVLAIVGESGSGKSVTANSILRLLPENETARVSGSIQLQGRELLTLTEREIQAVRGAEISMIFQDPMTAINPTMRVIEQIIEVLVKHKGMNRQEAYRRGLELLGLVGIPMPDRRARQYPFELSGGMKQRVMIAMALACEPKLIIADEPTTALDVTIQAQILQLLKELQKKTGAAILLITHDLGVVAKTADRVAVMYAGRIVECNGVFEIFNSPRHPYTKGLLRSVPNLAMSLREELFVIPGNPPNVVEENALCAFRNRCASSLAACHSKPMLSLYDEYDGNVECWRMHPKAAAYLDAIKPGREGR